MRFTALVLAIASRYALAQDTVLETVAASKAHTTLEAAVLAADSSIAETLKVIPWQVSLFLLLTMMPLPLSQKAQSKSL